MIEGNVIKFGYGDVEVTNNFTRISFVNIKPPQEIGASLIGVDGIERYDAIYIYLNLDECEKLMDVISNVNECNRVVHYKRYVFDFSNYNQKSVEVVLKVLRTIFSILCIPLAC